LLVMIGPEQCVCAYQQPFSRYTSQQRQNNHFLVGITIFDAHLRRPPCI